MKTLQELLQENIGEKQNIQISEQLQTFKQAQAVFFHQIDHGYISPKGIANTLFQNKIDILNIDFKQVKTLKQIQNTIMKEIFDRFIKTGTSTALWLEINGEPVFGAINYSGFASTVDIAAPKRLQSKFPAKDSMKLRQAQEYTQSIIQDIFQLNDKSTASFFQNAKVVIKYTDTKDSSSIDKKNSYLNQINNADFFDKAKIQKKYRNKLLSVVKLMIQKLENQKFDKSFIIKISPELSSCAQIALDGKFTQSVYTAKRKSLLDKKQIYNAYIDGELHGGFMDIKQWFAGFMFLCYLVTKYGGNYNFDIQWIEKEIDAVILEIIKTRDVSFSNFGSNFVLYNQERAFT